MFFSLIFFYCFIKFLVDRRIDEWVSGWVGGWMDGFVRSVYLVYFTECESGTFGLDCNKTCGNCEDMKHCHHVTGFCTQGCVPGYYGLRCTYEQRKSNTFF